MGRPRVAFVASGGGIKGIAHLGVLRAIEELALPVDVLVGASSGAIVAAYHAQGYSADDMIDWFRAPWNRRGQGPAFKARKLLGLPNAEQRRSLGYLGSGLLSVDAFERHLAETLRVNTFEGLDKPLLVTAADVDGRGRAVFGHGHRTDVAISQAVAASSCIPLIYRPYRIGERYYVDGEVVRTLSLDLAIEAGADIVIVSNVYRPHVPSQGTRSVAHSGIFGVGRQALNVVLSEKEKRGIDLVHRLYPHVSVMNVSADVGRYPFTSAWHAREMLSRGYREALRVLAAAKRRGLFEVASNVHTVGQA